jgi:hypothetical protein
MPDEPLPPDLEAYMRGDGAVSRQYRQESSPMPPHALDRLVLDAAGPQMHRSKVPLKSQSLAPLAFAASVLLSLALVLALIFGPQVKKPDEKPQLVHVRMFKSEPPRAALASPRERNPAAWLEDIAALRHAGRITEADVEMRRFRSAYPNYLVPINE